MTSPAAKVHNALKALIQLGPARLAENGLYRLGLRLGWWKIRPAGGKIYPLKLDALPAIMTKPGASASPALLAEAEQILAGQFARYGGEVVPLQLAGDGIELDWSVYESKAAHTGDIKDRWEPARFGWGIVLARAYWASGDERYAQAFWERFERFDGANPAYRGVNWTSGQEVALRLVAWLFAIRALAGSAHSSAARMQLLARAVAEHAARIPATLIYARSQDNNHLLSEAAGLYSAGLALPEHPQSAAWRRVGWEWFNRGLQRQLEPDGTYIQQSCNYHRLALQLACWMGGLARLHGERWSAHSQERLAAAVGWLAARLDGSSGRALNLGHNDGAYLFPFGEYGDYRPALQVAAREFWGRPALAVGEWDELAAWLGVEAGEGKPQGARGTVGIGARKPQRHRGAEEEVKTAGDPPQISIERDSGGVMMRGGESWLALRAANLGHRPGQADQLQVDLWFKGRYIAQDAGTFRYNAPPPWDNALASAQVHNSVTVDGREPMTRAGRFLWLDWDQAEYSMLSPLEVLAERNGYRQLGVRHRRAVRSLGENAWEVLDELLPLRANGPAHALVLHWLLPDWEWQWNGGTLHLAEPGGEVRVTLECRCQPGDWQVAQLVRAGRVITGSGEAPETLGWVSPTYGQKLPALSLRLGVTSQQPVSFQSTFKLF